MEISLIILWIVAIKKTSINKHWWLKGVYIELVRMEDAIDARKTSMEDPQTHQGPGPEENKSSQHRATCTSMLTTVLFMVIMLWNECRWHEQTAGWRQCSVHTKHWVTCRKKVDGAGEHHVKWNMPDSKGHLPRVFISCRIYFKICCVYAHMSVRVCEYGMEGKKKQKRKDRKIKINVNYQELSLLSWI